MAKLIITQDGRDKIYEIVDDEFTIGSGAEADLQLRDDEVSALHVKVRKVRQGFRLIDLESRTGTQVNGRTVNDHVLSNGDTIQLGDTKITYIGRGPSKAAAHGTSSRRAKRGPQLQSARSYRRDGGSSKKSNTPLYVGLVIVGVVVVFIFMLSSTDVSGDDKAIEIKNATELLTDKRAEALPDAEKVYYRYLRDGDLTEIQKRKLDALKEMIDQVKHVEHQTKVNAESHSLWVKIHNKQLRTPNDIDGIRKVCKQFLDAYPDADKAPDVREILADLEKMGEMTPDQRELARVQRLVAAELSAPKVKVLDANPTFGWKAYRISSANLRKAIRLIDDMDPKVAAVYAEEVEKLKRSVYLKARQWLKPRKDEAKIFLREGTVDEARAREFTKKWIIDVLPDKVLRDYLDSPDRFRNPKNQNAELAIQKLIRELMKQAPR